MFLRSLALAVAFAVAAPAFADETPSPSATASPVPTPPFDAKEVSALGNYGKAHPECAEWSDGCAVCRQDGATADGVKAKCSLPGIACQPVDIACRKP